MATNYESVSDDDGIFITQSSYVSDNAHFIEDNISDGMYHVETEAVSDDTDGDNDNQVEVTASDEEMVATCEAVESSRFKPAISDKDVQLLQSKRSVCVLVYQRQKCL